MSAYLSIVVPLYNEEESIEKLVTGLLEVGEKFDFDYEIIFVDDGSEDKTWEIIERLKKTTPELRAIKFRRNFLPILAVQRGFKAKEVQCEHYQQLGIGKSGFYGISHYFTIFIDILTLYFNTRFTRKPLRFFSSIGVIFLSMGGLITSYVFAQKYFLGYPVGGRPVLLLALLFIVLGVQAASVGLLGEIIAFTHGRHRKEYTIEKAI